MYFFVRPADQPIDGDGQSVSELGQGGEGGRPFSGFPGGNGTLRHIDELAEFFLAELQFFSDRCDPLRQFHTTASLGI